MPGATTASNANASPPNIAASASVVAGPAAATRNSSPAVRGSELSFETPPSTHSVMPSTFWPWRRATTEWASSWASTDAKNRITASTAAAK